MNKTSPRPSLCDFRFLNRKPIKFTNKMMHNWRTGHPTTKRISALCSADTGEAKTMIKKGWKNFHFESWKNAKAIAFQNFKMVKNIEIFSTLFMIDLCSLECAEHDGVDEIAVRPACDELCRFKAKKVSIVPKFFNWSLQENGYTYRQVVDCVLFVLNCSI